MRKFTDYTSLTLNGVQLKGNEIITYCESQKEAIFSEIANFIKDWLRPDPLMEIQTSGSTGKPKRLLVEKDKMLNSASRTAQYFDFHAGQKVLLCLPVNYIAGKMMIVRALFSRLNLICVNPSNNPLAALPSKTTIDFAAMIPMQLRKVLNDPALLNIKIILLGGGPVDAKLEQAVQDLSTEIFHGYGMTETLSHIAIRKLNGQTASLEYTALKGIELSQDDRQCLIIKAPGFLDLPVVTNDVVTLRGNKNFIWKGRYDHVVNSGGIKLQPEELEKKLQPLFSKRFFLTGIKDENLGEKLVLVIESEPLDIVEVTKLKNQMKDMLHKYEVPKDIYFIPEFKETQSGKINRLESFKI